MKTRHKPAKDAKPKKPRPHNPDKLTLDQVNPRGYKYRLLDRDEIKQRPPTGKIQCWDGGAWQSGKWAGSSRYNTYRTTLTRAELARLK